MGTDVVQGRHAAGRHYKHSEPGHRRRAGLIVGVLVLLATSGVLAISAFADEPLVSFQSSPQSFSPNGDNQEDTLGFSFSLARTSIVDIEVRNTSGTTVRALEFEVSRSAGGNYASWDGRNNGGQVLPEGDYTIGVTATDGANVTESATLATRIDNRLPGRIVAPVAASVVSGQVDVVFEPSAGVDVQYAHFYGRCVGNSSCYLGYQVPPDVDGKFRATADTTQLADGANGLWVSAVWNDSFGYQHWWTSAETPVTVDNPVVLSPSWVQERSFSPDGDNQDDQLDASYWLSETARVTITVRDQSGAVVRTLESDVEHPGGYYANVNVSWDGRDDGGELLPEGAYDIRVVATDASGDVAEATMHTAIDFVTPGQIVAPVAASVVSGQVDVVFEPSAGVDVQYAHFYGRCVGNSSCYLGYQVPPDVDGKFRATADTTQLADGANGLWVSAVWNDSFGYQHWWTSAETPVTVDNPVVINPSWVQERSFSPDGDNQDDQLDAYYWLSETARVTITVRDQSGAVVRTLESDVEHPGGYYANVNVSWDGRDDGGELLPEGAYDIRVVATDASGDVAEATMHTAIDFVTPGQIVAPVAASVVSGQVDVVFEPSAGVDVQYAHFYGHCVGNSSCSLGYQVPPDVDGKFRVSVDTTQLADGANGLWVSAVWNDSFGYQHWWTSAETPVTVNNGTTVTWDWSWSLNSRWFSPDGDGQEDQVGATFWLSQAAHVAATVTDGGGSLVRTLDVPTDPGAGGYGLTWDGKDGTGTVVPDGTYTLKIEATPSSGVTETLTGTVAVDTVVLGQLLQPTTGAVLAGPATFQFSPRSGLDVLEVSYSHNWSGQRWYVYGAAPDGTWRTTHDMRDLPDGPAQITTTVRFKDQFDQEHWWYSSTDVTVDNSKPQAQMRAEPASGSAPLATSLRLNTLDPRGEPLDYTLNFGDGSAAQTGTITDPYDEVTVDHTYSTAGAYLAVATVSDPSGNFIDVSVTVTATGGPNAAPTAELSLDTTEGTVPFDVTATIGGSDPDGDPLTYAIDFGDGSGRTTGALPVGDVTHRYEAPGVYVVRLEVSDGLRTAVEWATVRGGLSEPLRADAGDDQTVIVDNSVAFTGTNSRPLIGISEYTWDFGDGNTATGPAVEHTYWSPGSYTARLTVRSGTLTATDTALVTVTPVPVVPGLAVHVTGSGSPLPNADVLVVTASGTRVSGRTDGNGDTKLEGLPDGQVQLYAYAEGYQPATTTATIADGGGSITVDLPSGQVASSVIEATRLTLDEVVELGIDPSLPENQNVYEFEIVLYFGDLPEPVTYTGYATGGGGCYFCGGGGGGGGGGIPVGGGDYIIYPSVTPAPTPQSYPSINYLVIPGKAKFLKEFFEVKFIVNNLAPAGFEFQNGNASLDLPGGLSLAPTAAPQSLSQPVANIPGGGSGTATWIIRGDDEGEYPLSASYGGTLEPIGTPVSIRGESQDPLKVWGGSALHMIVQADDHLERGNPYNVKVGLQNVSDIPVYNPAVELLEDGRVGYIYQPLERLEQGTAVVQPGDTFWADYVLVPWIPGGDLLLDQSFVRKTAGNVTLASTITSQPAPSSRPGISSEEWGTAGNVTFEPIPGAIGYDAFVTHDVETEYGTQPDEAFPSTPVASVDGGSRNLMKLPAEAVSAPGSRIAVSTRFADGSRRMVHPLVLPQPAPAHVPLGLTRLPWSGRAPFFTHVRVSSPNGQAMSFRGFAAPRDNDTTGASGAIDPSDVPQFDVPAPMYEFDVKFDEPGFYKLSVSAELEDGRPGTISTSIRVLPGANLERYVALGDSYSSGEGNPPFESGTDVQDENECRMSTRAYPWLLAATGNVPRLDPHPCSGALIQHLGVPGLQYTAYDGNDLSPEGQFPGGDGVDAQDLQFRYLNPASEEPDWNISMVTLSIGGNDAGFEAVLTDCIGGIGKTVFKDWKDWIADPSTDPTNELGIRSGNCAETIARARERLSELSIWLPQVYSGVRKVAPAADLYVMGYPHLFPDSPSGTCQLRPIGDLAFTAAFGTVVGIPAALISRMTISGDTQRELNSLARELNTVIADSVDAVDGGVRYVDVEHMADGDEVCSASDNKAMNGLQLTRVRGADKLLKGISKNSFHPSALGHERFLDRLESELSRSPIVTLRPDGQAVHAETIPNDAASAAFRVQWGGSTVGVRLVTPSGVEIDTATPPEGVDVLTTANSISVLVPDPEAGEWTVQMTGVDVDPDGEPVFLDVRSRPRENAVPDVVMSMERIEPETVRFEVEATDSDGSITGYDWDYDGDGVTDESTQVGLSEHRYGPGSYSPMIRVRDDAGGVGTAGIVPELVIGDPAIASQAVDDLAVTQVGTPVDIDVRANDIVTHGWGEPWVYVFTSPNSGAADEHSGLIRYIPNADFAGEDSFVYLLCTDEAGCTSAEVALSVEDSDGESVPAVWNDEAAAEEDGELVVDVLANDSDPDGDLDPSTLEIVTQPAHGSATVGEDHRVAYVPTANYHGNDEFTYKVCDSGGRCGTARVQVSVTSVNDAPTAAASVTPTTGTAPLEVQFDASGSADVDGTVEQFAWDFGDGDVGLGATSAHTYADPGTYNVKLTITDDQGASAEAAVQVIATAPNTDGDRITVSFAGGVSAGYQGSVPASTFTVSPTAGQPVAVTGTGRFDEAGHDVEVTLSVKDIWRRSDGTCLFAWLKVCPAPLYTGTITVSDYTLGSVRRTPVLGSQAVSRLDATTVSGTSRWFDVRRFPWKPYTLTWTLVDVS